MAMNNGSAFTFNPSVRLKDVFLDESYGREPRQNKIQKFVRTWSRDKANAMILSDRRNGLFACLDSWHRVCACRIVEGPTSSLPALIYHGLSLQEEADYWVAYNKDRTSPIPAEVFRARLAAGDMTAKAIQAVLTRLELAISSARGKDHVRCVRALERVFSMDGGPLLESVLAAQKQAWSGEPTRDVYSEAAVHGLGLFLLRFTPPPGEVVKVLKREGPLGMRSEMYRMRQLIAGDSGVSWGRAFREKYNYRRTTGRLPEWPEHVYTPGGKQKKRERISG